MNKFYLYQKTGILEILVAKVGSKTTSVFALSNDNDPLTYPNKIFQKAINNVIKTYEVNLIEKNISIQEFKDKYPEYLV